MEIYDVIWKDQFVDKLAVKHGVPVEEVEEVLFSSPHTSGVSSVAAWKVRMFTSLTVRQMRVDI